MELDLQEVKNELGRRRLSKFICFTSNQYDQQWFHKHVADNIQDWHEGKGVFKTKKKLMLFMPPQHGKSQISSRHAPAWILGDDPTLKVVIAAYNGVIASKFSRDAQRIMDMEEYQAMFPETNIPRVGMQYGDELRNKGEVEVIGTGGSIVAVGVGGGLTSRKVDRMIIDDVYKDHSEAWSPVQRRNVNEWYDTVVETRLHNESRVLIVFTRWHEEDLAGYLLEEQPEDWEVISIPAIKDADNSFEGDPRKDGEALWPKRHSIEKLLKVKAKSELVFDNLYQQDPKPQIGLLYGKNFKTYDYDALKKLLQKPQKIVGYVDTADSGTDYLCAIIGFKVGDFIYIIDVVYNDKGVEVTQPLLLKSIFQAKATIVHVESNAGGSVFGKTLKKNHQKERKANDAPTCVFKLFHQSQNKEARIISNAANVKETMVFPHDWHMKWPLYYKHITKFDKVFKKNEHDDAPDATTGLHEKIESGFGSYDIG